MKDSVNILFVCGYGVGSSVMLQTVVKKALAKYDFSLIWSIRQRERSVDLPTGQIFMRFRKIA